MAAAAENMRRPAYRADIDGLRAIAVLAVVIFHAFPEYMRGGFVGVDVFFVISGYLIGSVLLMNLEQGTFRFSEFYSRRIRRIFPALAVVLIACLAYGWLPLLAEDYKQLGKHVAGGAGFVSNLLLWREAGYFDTPSASKPLLHLWSLSIEEQFYIVFPVLMWCAHRWKLPILPLMLCLLAISFALNASAGASRAVAVFYSPVTRLWELLSGVLLACLLPRMQHLPVKWVDPVMKDILSVTGFFCIAMAALIFTGEGAFPGWRGLLPVMGSMMLIICGPQALVNRAVLSLRPVVGIGLISYPLYLWHWPLLAYARIRYNAMPVAGIRVALLCASVFLAWLTYALVERRLRFGGANRTKVAVLCLLMAGVGAGGYMVYCHRGFPERYAKTIADITSAQFSFEAQWGKPGCFVRLDKSPGAALPPQCTDTSKGTTIVLWGDSHVATLYYGLKKLAQTHPMSISEYSGIGCPPLMGYVSREAPYCARWNDLVIREIARIKPDYVVLAARWYHPHFIQYDVRQLRDTTLTLQRMHVPRIAVIGLSPLWNDVLPKLLLNFWKYTPGHPIPPRYMRFGLNPRNIAVDQQMRQLSSLLGVDYISVYDKLCNADGCLTRIGDKPNEIAGFDEQHLSPPASEYFIRSIADYFIGAKPE